MQETPAHYWEKHVRTSLGRSVHTEPLPDAAIRYIHGGQVAVIEAIAYFSDDSELTILEHVEITDRPRRLKYSYHWQPSTFDFREWIRFDYVPAYGPDLEYHINRPSRTNPKVSEHERDQRRTLSQVVDLIWILIATGRSTRSIP